VKEKIIFQVQNVGVANLELVLTAGGNVELMSGRDKVNGKKEERSGVVQKSDENLRALSLTQGVNIQTSYSNQIRKT
jgi:hypothetical protein